MSKRTIDQDTQLVKRQKTDCNAPCATETVHLSATGQDSYTVLAMMDAVHNDTFPPSDVWFRQMHVLIDYIQRSYLEPGNTERWITYANALFSLIVKYGQMTKDNQQVAKVTGIQDADDSSQNMAGDLYKLFHTWFQTFTSWTTCFTPNRYEHEYAKIRYCPDSWIQFWNQGLMTKKRYPIHTMQSLLDELKEEGKRYYMYDTLVLDRTETFCIASDHIRQVCKLQYEPHAFTQWMNHVQNEYRVCLFLTFHTYLTVQDWKMWQRQLGNNNRYLLESILWSDGVFRLVDRQEPELDQQLPTVIFLDVQDVCDILEYVSCASRPLRTIQIDRSFFRRIVHLVAGGLLNRAYIAAVQLFTTCTYRKQYTVIQNLCHEWFGRQRGAMPLVERFCALTQSAYGSQHIHYAPRKCNPCDSQFIDTLFCILSYDDRPIRSSSGNILDAMRDENLIEHVNLWIHIFQNIYIPDGHWFQEIREMPTRVVHLACNVVPDVLARIVAEYL
jgi:hypothetical protein